MCRLLVAGGGWRRLEGAGGGWRLAQGQQVRSGDLESGECARARACKATSEAGEGGGGWGRAGAGGGGRGRAGAAV